ncbi:acyltransferase family protein [Amycolatopsis magusensis]|uniref:acyltransferase family protein n=1 Tax=Amycolatopsis magusensis TaxID=882444 RepID=UPI003C2F8912
MRGLAALGVLLTHVGLYSAQVSLSDFPGMEQPGNGFAGVLLQQLHVSLPIFFVLSGVLLYRPWVLAALGGTKKPGVKPYLWRRALRTLPAFWVALAVVLIAFNSEGIQNVWHVVRPFLLLQVYESEAYLFGLEQSWSLATEIAFYALLPVLAWALNRVARGGADVAAKARRIVLVLTAVAVAGFAFAAYTFTDSMGLWPIEDKWPLKWMGFIAAGMALATLSAAAEIAPEKSPRLYRFLARKPASAWAAALVVYLIACFQPFGEPGSANYPGMAQGLIEHVLYLSFGLLAVAPLTLPNSRSKLIDAVLTNPVMLYLGKVSYGLYLWHIAIIYFYNEGVFGADGFWELLAICFFGSLVAATLSYYLIESPAMRLREKLGKAPKEASVATFERSDHLTSVR